MCIVNLNSFETVEKGHISNRLRSIDYQTEILLLDMRFKRFFLYPIETISCIKLQLLITYLYILVRLKRQTVKVTLTRIYYISDEFAYKVQKCLRIVMIGMSII